MPLVLKGVWLVMALAVLSDGVVRARKGRWWSGVAEIIGGALLLLWLWLILDR